MEQRPLILTAEIDEKAQTFFNQKRQEFFPPERNYLDAHLTLFHKLPPENLEIMKQDIKQNLNGSASYQAEAIDIMFMGFGSAYLIQCDPLIALRNSLAKKWQADLTKQDQQPFKPHITFQNKVPAEEAKRVFAEQKEIFEPFSFKITGLKLWYYNNGPWEAVENGFIS